jgi:hypothetical protein
MSDHVDQCPFLNRSDPRCSRHLSLEHLQNAFRFCFGAHETCPQYAQLLMERRVRRGMVTKGERGSRGEEASSYEWSAAAADATPRRVTVEVTVAGRVQKPVVSAA